MQPMMKTFRGGHDIALGAALQYRRLYGAEENTRKGLALSIVIHGKAASAYRLYDCTSTPAEDGNTSRTPRGPNSRLLKIATMSFTVQQ